MDCRVPIRTNVILDVIERTRDSDALPITLAQAKAYLKMEDIDDDDALIESLIKEAVNWLETYCDISAVPQEVTAYLQVKNRIDLPCGPVTEIVSVVPDNGSDNRDIKPVPGFARINGYGLYTITYKAGYTTLPDALTGAILSYIAYCYEHRGDDAIDENAPEFALQARHKAFPFIRSIDF